MTTHYVTKLAFANTS